MNPDPNTHTADGWYTVSMKQLVRAGACESALTAVDQWLNKHHPGVSIEFQMPVTQALVTHAIQTAFGVPLWVGSTMRSRNKITRREYQVFLSERGEFYRRGQPGFARSLAMPVMDLLQARGVREHGLDPEVYLPGKYRA